MSEVNLPDVSLEKRGIFFIANGQPRQGDELRLLWRVWVVNQMQNMGHGITDDLAFGPAECDGQCL